jgi:ABC-2 type transport system ATP-binding protein
VRAPHAGELAGVLSRNGGTVTPDDDGALAVTGLAAADIGDLAASAGLAVHELTVQYASLEEAYLRQTDESVEYRVGSHA